MSELSPVLPAPLKPEEVTFPAIEPFENQYPDRNYTISIRIPEYTAVCPRTGLPDYGTIIIEYVPDQQVIELKAFKYYILAYRNIGIFYENAINRIRDDIVKAVSPRYLKVSGEFTPRGGISSHVSVEYQKP